MVLDVLATDESALLDAWKAVITTPELRQEWDPAVEGAHLVEMFDHRTRISKTQFTLGWPAKCVFCLVHVLTWALNYLKKSKRRGYDIQAAPGSFDDHRCHNFLAPFR